MTLFWQPTGPKVTYEDGLLKIENLNPHAGVLWVFYQLVFCRCSHSLISDAGVRSFVILAGLRQGLDLREHFLDSAADILAFFLQLNGLTA